MSAPDIRIRAWSTCSAAVLVLLFLFRFAVVAQAQSPSPSPSATVYQIGGPRPTPARRPTATRSPGRKTGGGGASANRNEHASLRGDQVVYERNRTIARGHAVAITETAHIEADEIEIDQEQNLLHARRNVVVRMMGDEVNAAAATYDLKSGVADLQDAYGVARNLNVYHASIEDSLFFTAPRVRWDGNVLRLIKATMTTCDLPRGQEHFKITGNVINVYPQQRLEIRKARLYLGGRQVVGRELVVLSLRERRRYSFIPALGYNRQDGAYIRENFPFLFDRANYGRVIAEVYQKGGFGNGLEYNYTLGSRGYGNLFYYNVAFPTPNRGRYELRDLTTLRLSPTMTMILQYQGNRYASSNPQVASPTSSLMGVYLSDSGLRHTLSLFMQLYSSTSFSGTTQTIQGQSVGTVYNAYLSDWLRNTLEVTYQQSSNDIYHSYFVHALDRLSYRSALFDTDLTLEKTSATGSPVFLLNRLPEVQVRSRLFNVGSVPLRLSLALGQYQEEPSGTRVGRADLKFAIPDSYLPLGEGGSLLYGAGIRQLIYDNGDKQYAGAVRADWVQDWSRSFRTHLDYRMQRGAGFSPLQADFFGQYNSLSGGIEFHDRDRFYLGLETGRDFLYNVNYDLRARLSVKPIKDLRIDLGTNYNIDRGQPMQLDSRVKLPLSPTLSVQYYGLYDFVNNRIAYTDFMIQNESHDFLTSLIYRGVQKEFFLQVNLKAFPFQLPSVGPTAIQPVLPRITNRGFRPDSVTPTGVPTPVR